MAASSFSCCAIRHYASPIGRSQWGSFVVRGQSGRLGDRDSGPVRFCRHRRAIKGYADSALEHDNPWPLSQLVARPGRVHRLCPKSVPPTPEFLEQSSYRRRCANGLTTWRGPQREGRSVLQSARLTFAPMADADAAMGL